MRNFEILPRRMLKLQSKQTYELINRVVLSQQFPTDPSLFSPWGSLHLVAWNNLTLFLFMSFEGHTFIVTYDFSLTVRRFCLHNTKLLFLCFSFGFSPCLPPRYFFLAWKNDNGAGPYLFRRHLKAFFPLCELKHTHKKS